MTGNLKEINKSGVAKVRYIGKKYAAWFGQNGKIYEAKSRHVKAKNNENVDWRIIDADGDHYGIAQGTLMDGLKDGWEVVIND